LLGFVIFLQLQGIRLMKRDYVELAAVFVGFRQKKTWKYCKEMRYNAPLSTIQWRRYRSCLLVTGTVFFILFCSTCENFGTLYISRQWIMHALDLIQFSLDVAYGQDTSEYHKKMLFILRKMWNPQI
jgi:hypothetical protein